MVLIFFSRCHVFYPLFHLSGLPFSFFVNNLTFSLSSTFLFLLSVFYPSSPFHTIFLPFTASPSRFYSFRPCSYYISPFQSFFAFSQLIFIFFAFSASSIVLHPLFAIFLDRPSFFRFYLCHFPRLIFHVSRLSKCFT